MVECFIRMDSILQYESKIDFIQKQIGCSICIVVFTPKKIYCGNAGDTKAVLGREKTIIEISEHHKPDTYNERKRIEIAGGFVADGKVNGVLE